MHGVRSSARLPMAVGYATRNLDFGFCDWVVNSVPRGPDDIFFGPSEVDRPRLSERVWFAFDAGEFLRPGQENEDPAEVYTRPLIEEIVRGLGHEPV